MCKSIISPLFGLMLLLSQYSLAGSISDFDLNTFDFDITTTDLSTCSTACVLSGTSNGIGWTISETSYWPSRTFTDGSFSFSALPNSTDNLHANGDYTITFDQSIGSLLVALSNDNTSDSINFGLTASDTQGVTMSGTQVVLDAAAGGLVLFENINSLTVTNLDNNGLNDGYDLAFHAVSQVPIPAAAWLFGSALLGLVAVARRR